ncbi:MAG: type I restriction endonuclease subunit R, partial [Bacteroidia bacterium]
MKRILFSILIMLPVLGMAQNSGTKLDIWPNFEKPPYADKKVNGHDFTIVLTDLPEKEIIIGYHHSGKTFVKDTAITDKKGVAHFKGDDMWDGGIYLVAVDGASLFEFAYSATEKGFTLKSTNANPFEDLEIKNSRENDLFVSFQRKRGNSQAFSNRMGKRYKANKKIGNKDSMLIIENLVRQKQEEMKQFQIDLANNNPGSMIAMLINLMREPEVPEPPATVNGEPVDTAYWQYLYFKRHFWDYVDFTDDRILRTPIFRSKVSKYIGKNLTVQVPDSICATALDLIDDTRMANKEVYELIKGGVPVRLRNQGEKDEPDYVKVLDFEKPENNEFLVVSQLSIEYLQTDNITRRPDLLLYVNGLPLVMIELKNATEKVKTGFDKNLTDYKRDIPQLFWYNLFVGISNGIQTRVGAFTAPWDHFFSWAKKEDTAANHHQKSLDEIEQEARNEKKRLSLQLFCQGLCAKERLLDYFENFVLYHNDTAKIIAKNHQYLGVNNAVESLINKEGKKGKLGIFWHTQGSGKSYSMIFFTRKVNRKVAGNWSFLIITDRTDLDDQIYKNFKQTEAIAEAKDDKKNNPYRPSSRKALATALQENKSFVFTLIHKFGIEKGKTYPTLTERDNWVVIVDEAHRTQYKGLAENMRIALPNAQFIAFTGTPLLRNHLTKDWFGPYVSEYNFAQSIEDGATVPLFYKKSVPKVDQINQNLIGDAAEILENENLTEEQKQKLDKEYTTLLQVVKREERLKEIARHIVQHYPYRLDVVNDEGQRKPMKAMVISIDKFTAVRMYDYVQAAQKEEIIRLRKEIVKTTDKEKKERYSRAIKFMQETKMAVVVSAEGSPKEEMQKFQAEGLDISRHRKLMTQPDGDGRDVEDYFKDANNTYRIVFVTAMWLTGFDAPAVSTLYLDKPLQNHTLMQTIARANRVLEGKKNGLVVDYFGVFRNLKKALASYAEGSKGKDKGKNDEDDFPVKEFEELLALLNQAIEEAKAYCKNLGADIDLILARKETAFNKITLFEDYANKLLAKDEYRKQLGLYVNTISSLYDSAKPEIYDHPQVKKERDAFEYLRKVVERQLDRDEAMDRARKEVDELLDT